MRALPVALLPYVRPALAALVLLLGAEAAAAQAPQRRTPALPEGLKTYLTADSTAFLTFNFVSQVWGRLNASNPGTTVSGELAPRTVDVGLRRIRLLLSGQLTSRASFFLQFGQNSFSYLSPRKTGAFFHDVTGEYAISQRALSVGAGLNGWNGPARYANSATGSILGLDTPLFQEATNDVTDQLLRQLGVYAKGKIGKLDYRFAVGKPFTLQTALPPPDPISRFSTFSIAPPHVASHGYVMYQFLESESNASASTVGSYLGQKRVFNLGAGFRYQGQAMWHLTAAGDTVRQALRLWAVDVFYDAPLNPASGTAITAYGGYYRYDFGPGYLRNLGAMNPADGVHQGLASFNGPGNAYPLLGTGSILYVQAGYLGRKDLLGRGGTLQPYASGEWARYDRLADPVRLLNLGVNWLLAGHHNKVTLNYESRPIFTTQADGTIHATGRRGACVLQYQLTL